MGRKERMRLIDADALKIDIMCVYGSNPKYIKWLNHAPTVDAVHVIRCKDCKHWACDDSESYCDELGIFNTDMNSYCSYAKRKEE